MNENILTTSDVAKMCNVATRTITQWMDKKILKGYKLPGSSHRRFLKQDVLDFMQKNDIPLLLLD